MSNALYTLADEAKLGNSYTMHISCRVHRFDERFPFVVRSERTVRNRLGEIVEQTLVSQFQTSGDPDHPPHILENAEEARAVMAEAYRRFIGKHREG